MGHAGISSDPVPEALAEIPSALNALTVAETVTVLLIVEQGTIAGKLDVLDKEGLRPRVEVGGGGGLHVEFRCRIFPIGLNLPSINKSLFIG